MIYLIIGAVFAAVGLVSSFIQIYSTVKAAPTRRDKQKLWIFFTIVTLAIAIIFFLASIPSLPTSSGLGSNPIATPGKGITPTPTLTPSPTSTLTPSPTSTATHIVLGTICTAGTNKWQGWSATNGGWKLNGGQLINDGSTGDTLYNTNLTPPPECQPTTPDYTVSATVTPIGNATHMNFLLFVRGDGSGKKGYALGIGTSSAQYYVEAITPDAISNYDNLRTVNIDPPNQGSQLTFTAKVVGIHLSLAISGYPLLSVDDSSFLTGEQIGIYAGSQLVVQSFSVTVEA